MTVNYDFVLSLKAALKAAVGVYVHFHDGCGGQYFTLEKTDAATVGAVEGFLAEHGMKPIFTPEKLTFTITEK